MGVKVFPSRASNVPDDPNLAHIGVVNPSHVTMQSVDREVQLAALYHHNDGNGGNAFREYRNNAVFLLPDNDDLSEIKQLLARHKAAAEMLELDDLDRKLLDYQRDTLLAIRQNSYKAAYHGIQRNWVNLFYPEPSVQPHGLASGRLQFPDREGRGQETVVEYLTGNSVGKMAHPSRPELGGNVWRDAGLGRAGADGMTVRALHDSFTRVPGRIMFRKRDDFHQALDAANKEGERKFVVIRTPQGREIRSGGGVSYPDDLLVWLKEYAPSPVAPAPAPEGPPPVVRELGGGFGPAAARFWSDTNTGQVAVAGLQTRMASDGLDWDDVARAVLFGAGIGLLHDMASKADGLGVAVSISYEFAGNGFDLRVGGKSAAEWMRCRRACEQMQRAAGVDAVDAQVVIVNEGGAVRAMLHDLDNTHEQVRLEVEFRHPATSSG